ncbi:MAG: AMP-binding protein [Cytophagales bacterium]|nr:AMP-binding protein [Cytophagales bacterium]MDW8384997.1 AMP-binding protein [Flammeovirgaceae bacterium]
MSVNLNEKPWLAHYPEGVPATINPDRYSSIAAFLEDCFEKYGNILAFENMGVALTYSEIEKLSRQFAAYLQSIGLKKGDRIAIQLPNLLQYPVAMFGALRAGLIVVNTNPLYTEREMEHQFKDSGAVAIVILANFASKLQAILPNTNIKHIIITEIGDLLGVKGYLVNAVVKYIKKMVPSYELPTAVSFKKALSQGAKQTFQKVSIQNTEIAFLQYTGGTTGVSKGAILTHRNILANIEQNLAWMQVTLKEKQEIVCSPLPLYHIFSLTVNCFTLMSIGAHNVLITNPKDMRSFMKEMLSHRFSVFTGVNTLFNAMMNQPEFEKIDFSNMRAIVAGGMALQLPVYERWLKLTGKHILQGYGLTETSPVVACNPLKGYIKPDTIGLVFPSTELKIMDDDGEELPHGEAGEICVRGPQVMQGYWQRPDETQKAFHEGGWFKTGDIGLIDNEGFVKIVDRKKDMILVSGFNVYPNEIEDVLAAHPKVLEVAAIGVPDNYSGEAVKVCIVRKDTSLTAEEVKEYCKKYLTSYKIPKYVEFKAELPKTNVGKILRRALREEAQVAQ